MKKLGTCAAVALSACALAVIDALITTELDCGLAGDEAEIAARIAALAAPPDCAWIDQRECAVFAPGT